MLTALTGVFSVFFLKKKCLVHDTGTGIKTEVERVSQGLSSRSSSHAAGVARQVPVHVPNVCFGIPNVSRECAEVSSVRLVRDGDDGNFGRVFFQTE
jgi:hypothetical protein